MSTVNIDEFDAEVERILKEAVAKTDGELDKIKQKVAKETVKVVREAAPQRTGKYKKSIASKKQGDGFVVYSNGQGQLTHLLEHGHVKKGGRGRVAGTPHFQLGEDYAIKAMEDEISKIEL